MIETSLFSMSDEKLADSFPPSNISYDKKIRILHNLRARIICEDNSLQGLLTFVPSSVVPDSHPYFEQVAYTNGDEMFFADRFFSLEIPVQCAVIIHEMLHIVFRHCIRGKKRISNLYNIACFKPGEPILTLEGFKNIEDLIIGDTTLVGGTITNTMENIYQDDMYTIKPTGCLNIEATQDHPFYVANFNSNNQINYSWKTAQELNITQDYLCIPKLHSSLIPPILPPFPSNFLLTNDLLYSIGYFLAKGSFDLIPNNRISSYFNSLALISSTFLSYYYYIVSICNSILIKEKTELPNWLLDLPNNLTASFIKGYFDGEGHRNKNKLTAWTSSNLLARQLQLLFAKHNKFLTIDYVESGYLLSYIKTTKSSRNVNNSQIWKTTKDYILTPIKHISKQYYEGLVYNIETETHIYLASNVVTHNCDAIINESIGFKDEQKVGSPSYLYLNKKEVVNLESIYSECNIAQSERKHFSHWTSESLYEYLIKTLRDNLQKQVENQSKSQNKKKGGKANNSKKPPDSSNNEESVLEKLEKEVEELSKKLASKHTLFAGDDIKEANKEDSTSSQIDDFQWTQRYNRAKAQSLNSNNSILGKVNPDVYKPQISWHVELRKYLIKRCMPVLEQTWSKPARRMGSLPNPNVYMPGLLNKKGLDKMLVIIDTSGSCFNEEELTMFCTEIQNVQTQTNVEIALIFADTKVRSEYIVKADGANFLDKIKNGWIRAEGGGGTDMVTPLLYGIKKYTPILSIIASDGYCVFPTASQIKNTNLLWVINTTVEVPKTAGKALYIIKT